MVTAEIDKPKSVILGLAATDQVAIMVDLVPEIQSSHDPMIYEQMVTTQVNPHFSKSDTSFHFPLTNVVDDIVDTSRLVGSDGNVPYVFEPVEHMSRSAKPVATLMHPPF